MKNLDRTCRVVRKGALACLTVWLALGARVSHASNAAARVTDVSVAVSDATPDDGVSPWIWIVNNVTWAAPASAVQVAAGLSAQASTTTAWSGVPLAALAVDGSGASASASIGGPGLDAGPGATGLASASAIAGDGAWAIAQLFDGSFLAGAGTTVTVTATVSDLFAQADGGLAQAVVGLQISGADGSGAASDQAWVFDSPDFVDGTGARTLTATWTNNSTGAATGHLWLNASAQAIAAAAIPEPESGWLYAVGLVVLGLHTRRRTLRAGRRCLAA